MPDLGIRITLGASACPPISPQIHTLPGEQGVDMARTSNRRRRLLVSGLALCAWAFALAFASPAIAETTKLVCQTDDTTGWPPWIFEVNYSAGTITITGPGVVGTLTGTATVTADAIKYKWRDSRTTFEGEISRLDGTGDATACSLGATSCTRYSLRCRPAVQKF